MSVMRVPYWIAFLCAVGVACAMSQLLPNGGPIQGALLLTDGAKATLDYLQQSLTMIVTLNSTLLAATATLVINRNEWNAAFTRLDGYLILFAFVSGAMSYYGAYRAQHAILEMLSAGAVSPSSSELQAAMTLQYYGLLTGVLFVGLTFCRMLERGLEVQGAKQKHFK